MELVDQLLLLFRDEIGLAMSSNSQYQQLMTLATDILSNTRQAEWPEMTDPQSQIEP